MACSFVNGSPNEPDIVNLGFSDTKGHMSVEASDLEVMTEIPLKSPDKPEANNAKTDSIDGSKSQD